MKRRRRRAPVVLLLALLFLPPPLAAQHLQAPPQPPTPPQYFVCAEEQGGYHFCVAVASRTLAYVTVSVWQQMFDFKLVVVLHGVAAARFEQTGAPCSQRNGGNCV